MADDNHVKDAYDEFMTLPTENLAFALVCMNVSCGMLSYRVAELEHRCAALEAGEEPVELDRETATTRAQELGEEFAIEGLAVARGNLYAETAEPSPEVSPS